MLLPGNQMVQALCYTLFYSLWQGLAMAVLAAIAILCTKKYRPVVRYGIFTGLLFAFIITNAATFAYQLYAMGTVNPLPSAPPVFFLEAVTNNTNALQPAPANAGAATLASKLFTWFTTHANSVVLCWLAIIALRC